LGHGSISSPGSGLVWVGTWICMSVGWVGSWVMKMEPWTTLDRPMYGHMPLLSQ